MLRSEETVNSTHTLPSSAEQFAQHTTEWAIPYERTIACLLRLQEWLETEPYTTDGTYPHFPIELRFSAPDDIWLSPANGRRTCWIGIIQFKYVCSLPFLSQLLPDQRIPPHLRYMPPQHIR